MWKEGEVGMNITFKRKNETYYEDLKIGDVFAHDGQAYMVTDQPEEDIKELELKSVNLSNGNMETFGRRVIVMLFDNATLTLE